MYLVNPLNKKICTLIASTWLGAGALVASPLLPASVLTLSQESEPVGATLLQSSSVPFTAPTFSGTLLSQVWTGDTANPLGGLTFTFQIGNDLISPDAIDRVTLGGYSRFAVDASYDLPGILTTSVTRSASGNQVSFNFAGPFQGTLVQGGISAILILQTDALAWQPGLAAIINSSSVNVPTFAPALAVPEPSLTAMVLVGGALLGAFRFRKID